MNNVKLDLFWLISILLSLNIIDLWLLSKFNGSCNTLSEITRKICVPSKTENVNLSVFILVIGIN